MIPITAFAGKKVAIFGLGGSGLAGASALLAGGADVVGWDDNAESVVTATSAGIPTAAGTSEVKRATAPRAAANRAARERRGRTDGAGIDRTSRDLTVALARLGRVCGRGAALSERGSDRRPAARHRAQLNRLSRRSGQDATGSRSCQRVAAV